MERGCWPSAFWMPQAGDWLARVIAVGIPQLALGAHMSLGQSSLYEA